MSHSLWHHGLQHTRLPCPSASLRVYPSYVKWIGDAIQPSHPVILFSFCLQSFSALGSFPKSRLFANYWSFSFCISPSNDYSGLISFKIDWFDLPSVQGILKSLPQYHNSKASILWHSASLWSNSHILNDYCKNHSFDYTDFVSKVMSLLFSSLVHINKTSQSWETLSMYILRILRYEKYDKQ